MYNCTSVFNQFCEAPPCNICVSSFKKIDKSDLLTAKDRFTHGHSLLNIDEIESLTVTLF